MKSTDLLRRIGGGPGIVALVVTLLVTVVATVPTLAGGAGDGAVETQAPTGASQDEAAAAPPGSRRGTAASRAFLDPLTGRLGKPSEEQRSRLVLSERTRRAASTSHLGLVEEALPGGGVKLDLQGRFRSTLFARIDENGSIVLDHSWSAHRRADTSTAGNGPQR